MASLPTISWDFLIPLTATCGATSLVDKEGYAVKEHTDGTIIICSSAGEKAIGILAQGAAVGLPVTIALPGSKGFAKCGAATTLYYQYLQADSDAMLIDAADGDYVCAISLGTKSAADGDIIPVQVASFYLETS
jgi:hypothetical protein